ncbi:hypothetical protein C8A05DRAFT_33927, partial [Staphylotrichum tortipilum]
MVELSIGEVSGLIAAGVFVVQIIVSLVFPAALIGFVGEENTVVTWSVLGRSLQSSPWPSVLQTDAAARHGVRGRISNGLTLQTVIVLLISVAAIVTPLGLYQTVEADGEQLEAFQFARDLSPFGYGTPNRGPAPFMRACGDSAASACPGSWKNETCVKQGLFTNCSDVVYNRFIPDVWRSALRDGASELGGSVFSIFDVQWRTQVKSSDAYGTLGWYIRSGYRQIGVLILDESIQLVDGLIVDAKNGGIGFRNHTVPVPVHEYGSTWSEDVLFVEPDAACVNMNITFDFELTENNTSRLAPRNMILKDHGGFSDLSRTSPDLTIPEHGNGQGPLDLRERAYKAAWYSNFMTLAYFNKTDPDPANIKRWEATPGIFFTSNSSSGINRTTTSTFAIEYQSIRSSLNFGEYLVLPATARDHNASATGENPFSISTEDFNRISYICGGARTSQPANLNSSLIGCGLLYGAAVRTDGGSPLDPQPGSHWSVPVYSCAASVRATVRTVHFAHNGTGLAGLSVVSTDRLATSPTWAVETIDPATTKLITAQPYWGLSPAAVPRELVGNFSAVRQDSLNLPGLLLPTSILLTSNDYFPIKPGQNLPALDFYPQALQNAFSIARPGAPGYEGYADYSGMTALAMYSKWRGLSGDAAGAAQIVKLVWTDIAANSVVGTKGWGLEDLA